MNLDFEPVLAQDQSGKHQYKLKQVFQDSEQQLSVPILKALPFFVMNDSLLINSQRKPLPRQPSPQKAKPQPIAIPESTVKVKQRMLITRIQEVTAPAPQEPMSKAARLRQQKVLQYKESRRSLLSSPSKAEDPSPTKRKSTIGELNGVSSRYVLPSIIHSSARYNQKVEKEEPKRRTPSSKKLEMSKPKNASMSVHYKSLKVQSHLKEQYTKYLKRLYSNEMVGTKEYLQDIQRLEEEVRKDGGDTYALSSFEAKHGERLKRTRSVSHPKYQSRVVEPSSNSRVDAATLNKFSTLVQHLQF